MEAIFLQLFISFGLVLGSILFFAFSNGQREVDHADRLALSPLDEKETHVDHE